MAYGTEAGLSAYAAARGVTISGTAAVLLVKAHDYIDSLSFIGSKATEAQDDQWPRINAWVDGYYLDSSAVPQAVIDAEYEAAISIDAGVDPLADVTPAKTRVKVGEIETEYSSYGITRQTNQRIMAKLRKYIVAGGGTAILRG